VRAFHDAPHLPAIANRGGAEIVLVEILGEQAANLAVVIDDVSLGLLNGAEVDFVEDLMGASFQIKNPNAASSCGCGNSFSVG